MNHRPAVLGRTNLYQRHIAINRNRTRENPITAAAGQNGDATLNILSDSDSSQGEEEGDTIAFVPTSQDQVEGFSVNSMGSSVFYTQGGSPIVTGFRQGHRGTPRTPAFSIAPRTPVPLPGPSRQNNVSLERIAGQSPQSTQSSGVGVVPTPTRRVRVGLLQPRTPMASTSVQTENTPEVKNVTQATATTQTNVVEGIEVTTQIVTKCCCESLMAEVNTMRGNLGSVTQLVEKLAETVDALKEGITNMPVPPTPPPSPHLKIRDESEIMEISDESESEVIEIEQEDAVDANKMVSPPTSSAHQNVQKEIQNEKEQPAKTPSTKIITVIEIEDLENATTVTPSTSYAHQSVQEENPHQQERLAETPPIPIINVIEIDDPEDANRVSSSTPSAQNVHKESQNSNQKERLAETPPTRSATPISNVIEIDDAVDANTVFPSTSSAHNVQNSNQKERLVKTPPATIINKAGELKRKPEPEPERPKNKVVRRKLNFLETTKPEKPNAETLTPLIPTTKGAENHPEVIIPSPIMPLLQPFEDWVAVNRTPPASSSTKVKATEVTAVEDVITLSESELSESEYDSDPLLSSSEDASDNDDDDDSEWEPDSQKRKRK